MKPSSTQGGCGAARLLAAAVLGLAQASCVAPSAPGPAPASVSANGAANVFDVYRLTTGDTLQALFSFGREADGRRFLLAPDHVVEVKFVHVPELNESQPVRPDGFVSLPYLGDVEAAGLTVAELTDSLKARYATVLKSPELYVVVRDHRAATEALRRDLLPFGRDGTSESTIRPDGYSTFTVIGDVRLVGLTMAEATALLNRRYGERFPGVACTLAVSQHAVPVVYVAGHVHRPGAINMDRPISLLAAISQAGGPLSSANLRSVITLRRNGDTVTARRVDLRARLESSASSEIVYLQPDDIVYVPQHWISRTAELARDVSDILMFRGWGLNLSWELVDLDSRDRSEEDRAAEAATDVEATEGTGN